MSRTNSQRWLASIAAGLLLCGTAEGAGFQTLSRAQWDEDAVRRVLSTFAYGGQATDKQITQWTKMTPKVAIGQMLKFDEHNFLLSPRQGDAVATGPGTLAGLRSFWASNAASNDTPIARRAEFAVNAWQVTNRTWSRATMSRGLNPFRQRIGLWETNYHLAVNQMSGIEDDQIEPYYDGILDDLARNKPYWQVLSDAASSAAITMQYGLNTNRIIDGACQCNQDFAREFHQLFFGILGGYGVPTHENVTIPNTARALTDMTVSWSAAAGFGNTVAFGTRYHDQTSLPVLEQIVQGGTAKESIEAIAKVAIAHPESSANLPVKIIAGLADDNLDEAKIQAIREAWAAMPTKNLLTFIRAYATSTTFHSPTRLRYLTSIDRQMKIAVQFNTSNKEVALDLYDPEYGLEAEDVRPFAPEHNVFGGQTGTEAVSSTAVFQNNFARATEQFWQFQVKGSAYGQAYEKDFRRLIPSADTKDYRVDLVAELLWKRLVGPLRSFGTLERAHVYSLLAKQLDPATALGYSQEHVVTTAELASKAPQVAALGAMLVPLGSTNATTRQNANSAVMEAIGFITATPYMFVEEGL